MPFFSRRSFLHAGTGAALASSLPGRHFDLVAQAIPAAAENPSGPRIRFASVGLGIQGSNLLRACMTIQNQAECVAVCDLYDGRHTLGQEITGNPSLRTTRNLHELLEDKTIDCIINATPDHQHKQVTLDALAAGKDVYCEKPMSHTIAEGESMVKAVKSGKNFVQVGSQRVSSELFKKAKSLYDEGAIGDLLQVELQLGRNSPGGAWEYPLLPDLSPTTLDWPTWEGTAPKKPFDPIAFHRWRCFKEYGTGMAGDLMVHLLSGMQFVTGINAVPDQAFSFGGIHRWPDGRNMPDVMTTLFAYGPVPVSVRLTLGTGTPEVTRLMGPKGILEVTDNTTILRPQTGTDGSPDYGLSGFPAKAHFQAEKEWHAEHDPALRAEPFDPRVQSWHGDSWDNLAPHLSNFFTSVRTRETPVEDVVFGHHAAAACHMANTSYFEGKVIKRA